MEHNLQISSTFRWRFFLKGKKLLQSCEDENTNMSPTLLNASHPPISLTISNLFLGELEGFMEREGDEDKRRPFRKLLLSFLSAENSSVCSGCVFWNA
jgi:hypothetical protein